MATANKLTYLNTTKQNIKTAINNAGANITNDTFRSYATTLGTRIAKLRADYDTALSYLPMYTKTGTSISITDGVELPTYNFKMTKESTQTTTTGKQLWNNLNIQTNTSSNKTFSQNGDGTFTLSDTATGTAYFDLNAITLPAGTYKLSTGVASGWSGNVVLKIDGITIICYAGSQEEFTLTQEATSTEHYIRCYNGDNYTGIVKPMIRLSSITDDTYEPYTNKQSSPSSNYPQEIKTVKGYKNFLPNSTSILTNNGITFTANSDGSVTANGTATNTAYYNLESIALPPGTYKLTGCPAGGGSTRYRIVTKYGNSYQSDYGSGSNSFTLSETTTPTERYIAISSGVTVDNLTFYPMIVEGTEIKPYVPYGTNWIYVKVTNGTDTIYKTIPLNGNEIVGIDTYKDELIIDKTGHCYLNKKTGKRVLDNTYNTYTSVQERTNTTRFGVYYFADDITSQSTTKLKSNYFVGSSRVYSYDEEGIWYADGQQNIMYFSVDNNLATTIEGFKEWLKNHNTIVYYPLETANLINLNYNVDMNLFEGTNTITNSETADMEITYVEDINTILATLTTPSSNVSL